MKKFAVFGNPITHSLSPVIHQMFAKSTGEEILYEKIQAPLEGFEQAVMDFFAQPNAVGCNVTMPFKTRAYEMAGQSSPEAQVAKAVNTLARMHEGGFQGFNTDGVGLVADLKANNIVLEGRRVLLLGAGGAARGVVLPLLNAGIAKLGICNRTQSKAQAIVDEIACERLECVALEAASDWQAEIIINSTAASLSNALPGIDSAALVRCEVAYDMAYAKEPTVFMRYALDNGCDLALDGLGMLVEQAAAAFTIWTGKTPATREVVNKVRAEYT
ncbi:shikimate dehydrogenase [Alteromonas aestuariivivens]|uniref:Shikimate dehydrogenase (NADP(+)) n=1 Tax=Alteromonas aestuariivivens TaxID=1938339 RepID=A0A3D8M564_9ALTE|nr:shikimate dehydrogenase [Alteromonas aestuariivivens]RDV24748.1 shikimate dehydrogenase [Alteromonas aestuariivivens]